MALKPRSRSHDSISKPMTARSKCESNSSTAFNPIASNSTYFYTWVCLKIGYIPNYSHLIGIMISKTIGFRGLAYFQIHPHLCHQCPSAPWPSQQHQHLKSWHRTHHPRQGAAPTLRPGARLEAALPGPETNLTVKRNNINKYMRLKYLVGGFNPSEKYESQLGWLFPKYGKHVPNHQPDMLKLLEALNLNHDLGGLRGFQTLQELRHGVSATTTWWTSLSVTTRSGAGNETNQGNNKPPS